MSRTTAAILSLTCLCLAPACGKVPSTTPCSTMCQSVAGTYTATSFGGSTTCANGDMLQWTGDTESVNVSQAGGGSALTLTTQFGTFQGTLHTDGTATFNATSSVVTSSNGVTTYPADLSITTQFSSKTPPTAGATYVWVRTSDGCRLTATASWTQ